MGFCSDVQSTACHCQPLRVDSLSASWAVLHVWCALESMVCRCVFMQQRHYLFVVGHTCHVLLCSALCGHTTAALGVCACSFLRLLVWMICLMICWCRCINHLAVAMHCLPNVARMLSLEPQICGYPEEDLCECVCLLFAFNLCTAHHSLLYT
jgi:hypothetical protein